MVPKKRGRFKSADDVYPANRTPEVDETPMKKKRREDRTRPAFGRLDSKSGRALQEHKTNTTVPALLTEVSEPTDFLHAATFSVNSQIFQPERESSRAHALLADRETMPDGIEDPMVQQPQREADFKRRQRLKRHNETTEDLNQYHVHDVARHAEHHTLQSAEQLQDRRRSKAIGQRFRRRDLLCQGLGYHNDYMRPVRHVLPPRNVICKHCQAEKWPGETSSMCCKNGLVDLRSYDKPPPELMALLERRAFCRHLRKYNNVFAFTSIGASETETLRFDQSLNNAPGVYCFRIQGTLCHRIGSLCPVPGRLPAFAQLYVFDTDMEAQVKARSSVGDGLDENIVRTIQYTMRDHNPLAQAFFAAAEALTRKVDQTCLVIHDRVHGLDQRRHNRPQACEVAAIKVGGETVSPRDIILRERSGELQRVNESHEMYDALQYPFLFPYGEGCWHFNLQNASGKRKITPREYAAYRLNTRPGQYSLLHRAGRLFHQYCVDQYPKVEAQRIMYLRNNQSRLRAELYSKDLDLPNDAERIPCELQQAVDQDQPLERSGRPIILPPTFTGGARYLKEQYQNAVAIVQALGKPDLFITVTCNPKWTEILENMLPGQTPADRPDIVSRVFQLKLKAILKDIGDYALGVQLARTYVVEFQKRGLPHAHILVILSDKDKPQSPDDYDKFVSAEIPDPENKDLYETVKACMLYGPCGARNPTAKCMKDGVCSKGYPKQFCEETKQGDGVYPAYRRQSNGWTIEKDSMSFDNRDVVPYNPWLCHKYNCHINVEVCSAIRSVHYLYNYVYKGHNAHQDSRDEITHFLDARYISASEACWRIFNFKTQGKSHTVCKLAVHLPDQQSVFFRGNESIDTVLNEGRETQMTKFFRVCQEDPYASNITYQEFPKYYRWVGNQWQRRMRPDMKVIGRMMKCSMRDKERYYLRMLLCYHRGPTSFEDLRTVDGVVYERFEEAAWAKGLENDTECFQCMKEAASDP